MEASPRSPGQVKSGSSYAKCEVVSFILAHFNLIKIMQKRSVITRVMCNPHGLGPTKLPLKTGMEHYGIYCNNGYGPSFGGGHDLHISKYANTNTNSFSNLGHSYQCPPGQQSTFFTGGKIFTVTDYEVFGLHE